MGRTSRKSAAAASTPANVPRTKTRERPPSPLSPTRITRMDEKKEMCNLNDRLACYIERVRAQEIEIGQLQHQVSSVEETRSTEILSMKSAYDAEMQQLRQALDDTSKDRARLQIEADKLEKENRELRARLRDKEKSYDNAAKELKSLHARYSHASNELSSAETELGELRPENARLLSKLEDAKKNLEDETLKRIDLQNQLQTSQEGLKFENQLLEQQLNETKVRKMMEISEIDGKLTEQYEEKLQEQLAELRETYEKRINDNRVEFFRVHDAKLKGLQDKLDYERSSGAGSKQELYELESKVSGFAKKSGELEALNASLNKRIAELISDMESQATRFRGEIARKDAELRSKEEQIEEMMKDYRDLMEIKVALDMEIAAYRKLLESEEVRLGLSPTSGSVAGSVGDSRSSSRFFSGSASASTSGSPTGRGIKRKRTMIMDEEVTNLVSEHSGKGDVIIEPLDKDGKFMTLRNNTKEDIAIGGWTLTNTSGDQDTTYKFHRSLVLKAEETCTIWSSDADVEHEPPSTLVMKKGAWAVGDENSTVLTNKNGEDEATRYSKKEKSTGGSVRRARAAQLYGQAGDLDPDNKNCAIM